MKYLIFLAVIFLFGCNSARQDHSPSCCSELGIDLSRLIGSEGTDCGKTWVTNYWWSGAKKAKPKIEQQNKKALTCVNKAKEAKTPYIYHYTFVSFPDGGYDYFAISTKEGKSVLIVHGSIGDEPLNYYVGYCENIEIKKDGSLEYSENECSQKTDINLFNSIKTK